MKSKQAQGCVISTETWLSQSVLNIGTRSVLNVNGVTRRLIIDTSLILVIA